MSSERAGAPTHGALNRERAREELRKRGVIVDEPMWTGVEKLLDALEACVVPDPRITRIEALLDDRGHYKGAIWFVNQVRAIIRGESPSDRDV